MRPETDEPDDDFYEELIDAEYLDQLEADSGIGSAAPRAPPAVKRGPAFGAGTLALESFMRAAAVVQLTLCGGIAHGTRPAASPSTPSQESEGAPDPAEMRQPRAVVAASLFAEVAEGEPLQDDGAIDAAEVVSVEGAAQNGEADEVVALEAAGESLQDVDAPLARVS
jgi:hypothetical protein